MHTAHDNPTFAQQSLQRTIFHPAYKDIPALRRQISDFLHAHGRTPAHIDMFTLALSEIITNIIKHPQTKASYITVTLTAGAETVLHVADDSTPFATFDAECNAARTRISRKDLSAEGGYDGLGCILQQTTVACYTPAEDSPDGRNHFTVRNAAGRKKTAFVIDDDHVALKNAHQQLSGHFDVVPFLHARDALAVFMQQKPDIIISDLTMPEMDGIALRRALTKLDGGDTIPFIFLTAEEKHRGNPNIHSLGIDDYLLKPVSGNDISSVAHRLIARTEQVRGSIEGKFHHDVTRALRPDMPTHYKGWNIALRTRAAEAGGGDFVFHHERDDCMLAVLADVMGHGIQAKFFSYAYAGYLRSLFRTAQETENAAHFLTHLAASIDGDTLLESMIMTCQSFQLYPDGRLSIASAGHPRPALLRDGMHETIDVTGPMPALAHGGFYTQKDILLHTGETILFATDGFFDAMSPPDYIQNAHNAEDTATALWEKFIARNDHRDDATLIVATYIKGE
jgi:serine/threonine-protein kinase RsbW